MEIIHLLQRFEVSAEYLRLHASLSRVLVLTFFISFFGFSLSLC